MCVVYLVQVSKISLVDLAGSERAKDTGAEGKRLQVRRGRGQERIWGGGGGRRGREGERRQAIFY